MFSEQNNQNKRREKLFRQIKQKTFSINVPVCIIIVLFDLSYVKKMDSIL